MAGSQEIDTTKGPLAGLLVLYKMRESRLKQHARRVSEVPILASGYQEGVRACDLVEELGHHGGSSSVQAIRETLDLEFPHLDKRGVAEIIAVALHFTSDGPKVEKVDPHAGLVAHLATATARYKEVPLGCEKLEDWKV
ncbi:unnamed protein product [Cladocopium goreaui]|uniref:Transposon protein n=1 Tax=Cladocopium goreaui TaxID=2562237 RepID=A0A9P1CXN8_9DINO|nr:unnamed protein product [Cladocopium goreaui]